MKLVAHTNSEFETLLKELHTEYNENIKVAKDIVEKYVGVRPESFYIANEFGDTGCINIDKISFAAKDINRVDKNILRIHPDSNYYEANPRIPTGCLLRQDLADKVSGKWLTGSLLKDYGIQTLVHERLSFSWLPKRDDNGHYYLSIADTAFEYMDKNILAKREIMLIEDAIH